MNYEITLGEVSRRCHRSSTHSLAPSPITTAREFARCGRAADQTLFTFSVSAIPTEFLTGGDTEAMRGLFTWPAASAAPYPGDGPFQRHASGNRDAPET